MWYNHQIIMSWFHLALLMFKINRNENRKAQPTWLRLICHCIWQACCTSEIPICQQLQSQLKPRLSVNISWSPSSSFQYNTSSLSLSSCKLRQTFAFLNFSYLSKLSLSFSFFFTSSWFWSICEKCSYFLADGKKSFVGFGRLVGRTITLISAPFPSLSYH